MARANRANKEVRVSSRDVRRKARVEKDERVFSDKFEDERISRINTIVPKTDAQADFMSSLNTSQIVVGMGSAGTGKTYLAATHAANQYLKESGKTIYISRPYVTMGKSAGMLPGTLEEKMLPFLAPIVSVLKKQLGPKFDIDFGKNIHVQLIEAIRGLDLSNAILIVDEAQNLNREEIKSIVTRLGENSQIILVGDSRQSDLPAGQSGLEWLVDLIDKYDIQGCDFVEFGPEDIVRSGIVKEFVKIFDKEGI